MKTPEIVITMGDPSGIGPEIIAGAVKELLPGTEARFTVTGEKRLLDKVFSEICRHDKELYADRLFFADIGEDPRSVTVGRPSKDGALQALRALELALEIVSSGDDTSMKALVTAPVSKENLASIKPGFRGHTEFLQEFFGSDFVTMAFVGDHMRTVPVTRHLSLKDVPSKLTSDLIARTVLQVIDNRKVLSGIDDPAIIVTALNPHAGEGGRSGTEEIDVICPAIEKISKTYAKVEGPVPSDVAFYKALSRPGCIVVGMYHDQCLGPFKMLDFSNGVNMTLGLDIVRTSPDHGTAFDIAGKGEADPGSMKKAIELAIRAVSGG